MKWCRKHMCGTRTSNLLIYWWDFERKDIDDLRGWFTFWHMTGLWMLDWNVFSRWNWHEIRRLFKSLKFMHQCVSKKKNWIQPQTVVSYANVSFVVTFIIRNNNKKEMIKIHNVFWSIIHLLMWFLIHFFELRMTRMFLKFFKMAENRGVIPCAKSSPN